MDRKSWIALGVVYLVTWALMYWISVAESMCASYFLAIWLLPWVPGIVGLISAKLEGLKIFVFGDPSWWLVFSFLTAYLLGIYISYRPDPYQEYSWCLDILFIYPLFGLIFGVPNALGESIFWWGYLYKKLEKWPSLVALVIIGVLWGLWHAPLILMVEGYFYDQDRLTGIAMMPLVTTVLSPVMFYLRHKGQSALTSAIFFGILHTSVFLRSGYYGKRDDFVEGVTGINGVKTMLFWSCLVLILLGIDWFVKRRKRNSLEGNPSPL